MNDELLDTGQSLIGRVRSMVYLLDEPATTLTIQVEGRTITARAFGQIALDLRALPRGATISIELIAQPEQDYPQRHLHPHSFLIDRVGRIQQK